MFADFLETKPVKSLLGEHLQAEYFTDDTLGRSLDRIYDYGVNRLFSEIAIAIAQEQQLFSRAIHIDTTSLAVYGDYDEDQISQDEKPAKPKHGYSKGGMGRFKQMILNMATHGKAAMPIWMEALSGNVSDKKSLHAAATRMDELIKGLKEAPSMIFVGDSAIFDACLKNTTHFTWLTRASENHKAVKQFSAQWGTCDPSAWIDLGNGYKQMVRVITYKGVQQRWALIFSQQAYEREIQTLEKRIQERQNQDQMGLREIMRKTFACEQDAARAISDFKKDLKYHDLIARVEKVTQYPRAGRPAKDDTAASVHFKVEGVLERNQSKIQPEQERKGRFVLATNELNKRVLPDDELLKIYKEQADPEKGFKFIKDDAFQVSSVFLKKATRINALMMVMVLCLLIYNLAQYTVRKSLLERNETVPNQLKKPIGNPSMKWIFYFFHNIQRVYVAGTETHFVINLREEARQIIHYFGPIASRIYDTS
jgi:transposase